MQLDKYSIPHYWAILPFLLLALLFAGCGTQKKIHPITENHHGEMTVESRPGAGAKFIIRLPVEGVKNG